MSNLIRAVQSVRQARRIAAWLLLALTILACAGSTASAAAITNLDQPGPRAFIVDKANLISAEDKEKIRTLCDKLLTDKATPIIVVTINSMAEHGGSGMRIETFAMLLFNQWGIGHAKINDQVWNTGILVLVSKNDRKARIELGAHWRHDQDVLAQKIMNEQMIPRFKKDEYSAGILAAVESLDKMARGLELPKKAAEPPSWQQYAVMLGLVALAVFTVVSLIRRGSGGWAWLLWAGVFAAIGYLLYSMMQSSSRGDGGGFSGGSFGGGFSGGGGASGSW